jgi:predicted enzyme related to lactoylglutathione lyase
MSHPFVYAELHTTHPAAAKRFYTDLFGWSVLDHDTPGGQYTEIHPGEGPEAGLMGSVAFDQGRSHWLPYIQVAALDEAAEKAVKLGAKLQVGRTEIPQTGWFCWLEDPTGAPFALWEKAAAAK